jgi:5-formyltetrahydrofolate cyclo-ligase
VTERQALRQQLRQARRAFDVREQAQRSEIICQQLVNHRLFRASKHIACYLPNDGEVDLAPLMARAWAMGKTVYLPVLSAIHHNRLHFLPYAPGDTLMANSFGIPEPVLHSRRVPALTRLDLVLTPLVGFDEQGNRLGMGGGFYDRTFAFLRRRQTWRKPHLVGVAFDVQKSPVELPHQNWDVPLEGVVTESGVQMVC